MGTPFGMNGSKTAVPFVRCIFKTIRLMSSRPAPRRPSSDWSSMLQPFPIRQAAKGGKQSPLMAFQLTVAGGPESRSRPHTGQELPVSGPEKEHQAHLRPFRCTSRKAKVDQQLRPKDSSPPRRPTGATGGCDDTAREQGLLDANGNFGAETPLAGTGSGLSLSCKCGTGTRKNRNCM